MFSSHWLIDLEAFDLTGNNHRDDPRSSFLRCSYKQEKNSMPKYNFSEVALELYRNHI